jgi:hypothetical protein
LLLLQSALDSALGLLHGFFLLRLLLSDLYRAEKWSELFAVL